MNERGSYYFFVKMGNTQSEITCTPLTGMDSITDVSYTVLRGSGEYDDGWIISKPPVVIENAKWIDKHAWRDVNKNEWRIFLHNNQTDPNLFKCGWRRISTIRPTHLTEDEVDKWRESLIDTLDKAPKFTAKY